MPCQQGLILSDLLASGSGHVFCNSWVFFSSQLQKLKVNVLMYIKVTFCVFQFTILVFIDEFIDILQN